MEGHRQTKVDGDRRTLLSSENDILDRERTEIGEDGRRVKTDILADNRIAHGFARKLVDQKVGYLLGKPLSISTEKEDYAKAWSAFLIAACIGACNQRAERR